MPRTWTTEQILSLAREYQAAAVLTAAADLDVFTTLAVQPLTAAELAREIGSDLRGTTILLDALTALELLKKTDGRYRVPAGVLAALDARSKDNVLAMVQHQGSCLRRWSLLAHLVQTGKPGPRLPGVRGEQGDFLSFIEAMDNISRGAARPLVAELQPLAFQHLLDVGGASGTWTIAFLQANPDSTATATLFDAPAALPLAEKRLTAAGVRQRVRLTPGDFMQDPLPGGADLAWVSAIVHQNSRAQNRRLFANVHQALAPGGRVLLRDIVMHESRTAPVAGALFAVNMLTATEAGGTFTFPELRADLEAAGFTNVQQTRQDEGMHAIIAAVK